MVTDNASAPEKKSKCVSFVISPFKTHKLSIKLPKKVKVSRNDAIEYYKSMVTIRKMEEMVDKLLKDKVMNYFCHLYIGQEACAVGVEASILPEDDVAGTYRIHGWAYTRGIPIAEIMAEILGRSSGCCKGKGGSMHMYHHNFYGGNSIVGASVPIGAGVAFSHKYKRDGRICVTCYGDGAANQGQVFETFNMASMWKLPVIFVCENNTYGKSTPCDRVAACTEFFTRGDYIPGIRVDGMDVLAVREATRIAKEYALKSGPIILELLTYRFCGHSSNDPGMGEYRPEKEVTKWRKNCDPISIFRSKIIKSNLVSKDVLDYIDEEIDKLIGKETAKALSFPEPDIAELGRDVYVTNTAISVRSCNLFEKLTHDSNI